MLPGDLAAAARPNGSIRPPKWQHPPRFWRLLPQQPRQQPPRQGGCCPAAGQHPPCRGGCCLGRAAPAQLLPREGSSCLGRTFETRPRQNQNRIRLPRQQPPAAAAWPPQHPFGLEADAARPPSGCCPAARRLLGRLLPGSGRLLPGRWAAAAAAAGQHPLDRTTPKQNLKTPAYAAILIFCDDLYSPEKRLTVPIRTCRGRAPETSPDHRTRQIAPLLSLGCFLSSASLTVRRSNERERPRGGWGSTQRAFQRSAGDHAAFVKLDESSRDRFAPVRQWSRVIAPASFGQFRRCCATPVPQRPGMPPIERKLCARCCKPINVPTGKAESVTSRLVPSRRRRQGADTAAWRRRIPQRAAGGAGRDRRTAERAAPP